MLLSGSQTPGRHHRAQCRGFLPGAALGTPSFPLPLARRLRGSAGSEDAAGGAGSGAGAGGGQAGQCVRSRRSAPRVSLVALSLFV